MPKTASIDSPLVRTSVHLPRPVVDQLDREGKDQGGASRASVIRRLIEDWAKSEPAKAA